VTRRAAFMLVRTVILGAILAFPSEALLVNE
jgi:hypothetical protein